MSLLKRAILVAVLVIGLVSGCFAAGLDLVVMVDTSASMFPYYDELVKYLLKDLLEHWLRKGDTFHLLSFADQPEAEIAAKIERPEDLTRIIERIYLLEPLGRYTDLVAALDYLYEYLSGLQPQIPKLVLMLTDGVHDPPPDSPNRGKTEQVLARLLQSADRIRMHGWEIHILQTPAMPSGSERLLPGAIIESPERPPETAGRPEGRKPEVTAETGAKPAAGMTPETQAPGPAAPPSAREPAEPESGRDLLQAFADRAGATVLPYSQTTPEGLTGQLTGFLTLRFPDPLGKVGRRFTAVFTLSNPGAKEAALSLVALRSGRMNLLARASSCRIPAGETAEVPAVVRLPLAMAAGDYRLPATAEFRDEGLRVAPLEGTLAFTLATPLVFGVFPLYLLLIVLAAVLIILAVVLTVTLRNLLRDRSFSRLFATRRGRARPLILKVSRQNPNIGTRNIHEVPPRCSRSVGGDGSVFLIYYLPMPRNIGYIRNDGKRYSFVPKKLKYFPELKRPLEDCLNREIQALSLHGREVRFVFQEYVSPLAEINRLLRSVKSAAAAQQLKGPAGR
jgi:hypothetical protein